MKTQNPQPLPLGFGCIETAKEKSQEIRLLEIYTELSGLIGTYHPEIMAVEDLFFSNNAKTAISVGQSRGVVLLTAAQCHIPVVSYSPLVVKRSVTGDGQADKKQVSRMVCMTLKLAIPPKLDDTTDALAIAMTHAYSYKISQLS
jgi:crossover junction endodeoxyribonuclease RuvC